MDRSVRVQCLPGKSSGPRQAGFRPERRLANRDAAAGKACGALEKLSPNGTEDSPGLGNLTAEDKQFRIERVSQAGQGGRQRRGSAPNDCLRDLVARASGGKNIQAGQGCRSFSESFAEAVRLASAADSRERVTLDGPGREDSFQAAAIARKDRLALRSLLSRDRGARQCPIAHALVCHQTGSPHQHPTPA